MSVKRLAVIGGGAWGTALAVHFVRKQIGVRLWMKEADLVERMRTHRENPVFLPGVPIPDQLHPTSDLQEAVEDADLALMVVPSQYARRVYAELAPHLVPDLPLLVAAKGIEEGSLALPLEVAAEEFGSAQPLAVLSGPSYAAELVRGRPTVVVVAALDQALARSIQCSLASGKFRLYTGLDPVGVQVAAALKNVMAIAAGIAEGLGMGPNTQAALITRGLAEISRLGEALGGRPATFRGLAGLGDLVLTCTGELSRNRQLGCRLGAGESLHDILASSQAVVEGVGTTRSSRELARRENIEMPIVEEIHGLLFDGGVPEEAITRLMTRPLTSEE
jgi:glycerol-3-phosphate dehydrogenase (NAD(P)+)